MEGRVIPADRRGSCCFLLGIVTVTFHGASHAGITNKSSLSVLKNHPVFRGEGVLISEAKMSSSQIGCSFLDLVAGSASTISTQITKGFGQLLTPSCPSKIIFLHVSHCRVKKKKLKKKKKKEQQQESTLKPKFSVHSPWKKNPPNLQCCLEGGDTLLRLLRTAKLKNK